MKILSARKFREYREKTGLRQKEVTKECGVSDVVISRLETDRSPRPRSTTLKKLAAFYGCGVSDFYVEVLDVRSPLLEQEIERRIRSLKIALVGIDPQLVSFNIEMTLNGGKHRNIQYAGKPHDNTNE